MSKITVLKYFRSLHLAEKVFLCFNLVLLFSFLLLSILATVERKAYLDVNSISDVIELEDRISFEARIRATSSIFKASDLFEMNVDTRRLPENIEDIEYRFSNLFIIKSGVNILNEQYLNTPIEFHYTLKVKKDVYMYLCIFILITIFYFIIVQKFKKIILHILHEYKIYFFNFAIFALIYILILIFNPVFNLNRLAFSIVDFLSLLLCYFSICYISNKNIIISSLFTVLFIGYFFIIQNIVLTFQNNMLSINNIKVYFLSAIVVVSRYQQIFMIILSILYFGLLVVATMMLVHAIVKYITRKKIIVVAILLLFVFLFNNISIKKFEFGTWRGVSYTKIANQNGVIVAKNFNIYFNKLVNKSVSKEDVLNAIGLLKSYEHQRNIDQLLLKTSKQSIEEYGLIQPRDVYFIILESFYDYSDFITLFDGDPFSEEYRIWANVSQKIGPNTGGGSYYARSAGLTGASPLQYTATGKYPHFLPDLFNKNGYNTIALEEAYISYDLDYIFPALGFDESKFYIGTGKIDDYISNNILTITNAPKFIFGFTRLGHTGSLSKKNKQLLNVEVGNNISNFLSKIQKNDNDSLTETLMLSILLSREVIQIRDLILNSNPNALIIFKHDHLYPHLRRNIEDSNIENNLKDTFLNTHTPTPILIWDGTNGAYKTPINFAAENIPLFIALNTGLDYENSVISMMYKDTIDNQFSTYHKYYSITNEQVIEITSISNVHESLVKLEEAKNIISKDIFIGRKYTYEYFNESNQ